MILSYKAPKSFLPEELQSAFDGIMQKEAAARGPDLAAKFLSKGDSKQLEFDFTFSKTS